MAIQCEAFKRKKKKNLTRGTEITQNGDGHRLSGESKRSGKGNSPIKCSGCMSCEENQSYCHGIGSPGRMINREGVPSEDYVQCDNVHHIWGNWPNQKGQKRNKSTDGVLR